nr:flavodoxin family protein [uncultured Caproiciproducens sp.]
MKKCLIVYYSYHHGNTEKIAAAMAETAGAELCTIDGINGKNLQEYEIIGFGAGIAFSKHYDKLLKATSALDLHGKSAFVFSTSGTGGTNHHAALIEQLKTAGADIAGNFACKGFDTFGPFKLIGGVAKGHPDTADIEAAKRFILEMVK